MKIKKAAIIKALQTEPKLRRGRWVREWDLPVIGNCAVCAVGAVLRQCAKAPNILINQLCDLLNLDGFLDGRGGNTDRLAQLSRVFEQAHSERTARSAAIAHVEENFPETITIPDDLIREAKIRSWSRLIHHKYGVLLDLFGESRARDMWSDATTFKPAERRKLIAFYEAEHTVRVKKVARVRKAAARRRR